MIENINFFNPHSLTKLQRKMYEANLALQYFILTNWHFQNDNFMSLCSNLKLQDLKSFYFNDFMEFDLILYFRYAVLGGKKYLLGETEERIPIAKRKYRRMKLLDQAVKAFFCILLFWLIFIKYDILGVSRKFCISIGRYHC